MAKSKSSAPTQRQLRVGEEIRHVLSGILGAGDLRDPDLAGVSITVSEVRPSPDLRNATAYVMPLAGQNQDAIIAALNRAAGYLRGQLGKSVHLKFTPALKFVADVSYDEAARITSLLREGKVAQDLTNGLEPSSAEELAEELAKDLAGDLPDDGA